MARMAKSKISTVPQPTIEAVEKSFQIVAYSNLKVNSKPLTMDNIETEAQRIERCVEYYYIQENHEKQYLEFAADFLMKNYKELVFGTKYALDYLMNIKESKDSSDLDDYTYYNLAS